jgi:hypothetical protein
VRQGPRNQSVIPRSWMKGVHPMSHATVRACALALASLSVVLVLAPAQTAGGSTSQPVFSGQAKAVDATLTPPFVPAIHVVLADTGMQNGPAFEQEASGPGASVPPSSTAGLLSLDAETLSSSTLTEGSFVTSQSTVLTLDANVGGIPVSAELLTANAQASCNLGSPSVSGNATLLGASVGGIAIGQSVPANTRVDIPGTNAYVLLNEQHSTGHTMDVTAIHVIVPGVADVAIASAHADVLCPGGAPNCARPRFVTGGGWLTSGLSRANFAIAARDGGSSWGHLLYRDKSSGRNYRGTPSSTTFLDDKTVQITGVLADDGRPFVANVVDNGEPGNVSSGAANPDTFSLAVDGTTVNSGPLQGGNIQVHRPCSG